MEKIVAANFKMNMTLEETKQYLEEINNTLNDKRVILFPTSIYIPYFVGGNYSLGVQNIASYDKGAYTGEISPMQVKSMGVNYTLVGHSERRSYYNETDDVVNAKVKRGLNNNLKIILCIGETKEERDQDIYKDKISKQIMNALKDVDNLEDVIIAYEPIWAIGTSITPTMEQIRQIVLYIKEVVKQAFNTDIRVLYGGSVNDENIKEINDINELTGVLVGGASLVPEKLNIIREVVLG